MELLTAPPLSCFHCGREAHGSGQCPKLRYRQKRRAEGKRRAKGRLEDVFIGVDSEGWSDPTTNRHYMMALIAGEEALYTGEPIGGEEALRYLGSLSPDPIYVGYFFDYDATMLLRDIASDSVKLAEGIFDRSKRKHRSFIWWHDIGIQYLPKKFLRVKLPGEPAITIHDVRGFFQCSFVKALTTWDIGTPEERQRIADMKAQRADFDPSQAQEIIDYSKDECRLLAQLVSELRDRFVLAGLNPYPYEGPGPVAGKVLSANLGRKASTYELPEPVYKMAQYAYYGGRFETAAHGAINVPVYEYDIKSAYPDAMTRLPCLEHGRWVPGIESELWVGQLSWHDPEPKLADFGPLPFRESTSVINYPTSGQGWYWSVEAENSSHEITGDTWSYIKRCKCQPFAWVSDLFERRALMDSESPGSGIPLKLVLNSLYGKLCQRIGTAPHYQPVWASLITAMTRAKVYQVYLDHPHKVAMYATDAVFTTEPCPELTLGSALGEWDLVGPFTDLFIFQPGVYFDGNTALLKTRGTPQAILEPYIPELKLLSMDVTLPPFVVEIPMTNHLGLRQALAWNTHHYQRCGDWIDQPRKLTPWVSLMNKREAVLMQEIDGVKWTPPISQDRYALSAPYKVEPMEFIEAMELWEDGLYDGSE